jgi:hypothetical protein
VSPSAHIALGDVNGDGKLEVVMGSEDGGVDMLVSDDHGGFLAPVRTEVGTGSVAIALGDLHGDGQLEIVAAASESASVSVIGSLGPIFMTSKYPLPNPAIDVAVGDVNGDGKAEIVAIHMAQSSLSVLQQQPEGGYVTALTTGVGDQPVALALADLHGDGHLDAITANERGGSVSILHFMR